MNVWLVLCFVTCFAFVNGEDISNGKKTAHLVQDNVCDCGLNGKCEFDKDGEKVCMCEEKYGEKDETCKETCNPESADEICANKMPCIKDGDNNFCDCKSGLSGDRCEIVTDCKTGKYKECEQSGGECKFEENAAICDCKSSQKWNEKKGICEICDCGLNGKCEFDKDEKKVCMCEEKYGEKDETCKECECGEKGITCKFFENSKECNCTGNTAQKKDKCVECDCGIEGTCRFNYEGNKVCDCNPGFLMINGNCENPCEFDICKNAGVCVLNGTDFMCECKSPYFGKLCQFHPCLSNPCVNDGACIAVENDYGCVCKEPFHGKHCEIDPCSSGPCMNGGVCSIVGIDFNCTCTEPYSGKQCEFNPCSPNPCKNNGICNVDNDKYYCYCKMPFYGHTCEEEYINSTTEYITSTVEYNTKLPRTTRNENTTIFDEQTPKLPTSTSIENTTKWDDCDCGINSLNCYLYRGKTICKCKENYAQRNRTCAETCKYNSECLNGGLCKPQGSSYFCKCPDVYLGDRCQIDVCRDIKYTCKRSGATCKRQGDTGVCQCPEGKAVSRLSGMCEDTCGYDTCVHGYCRIIEGIYKCVCNNGFTGRNCDKKITQTTDAVLPSILISILAVGIVIFSVAAIIAICWVKRLNGKLTKTNV